MNGWHEIDITQLVQAWIDNGLDNYGLLIRAQIGSKFSKFYSKEHSNSNLHPFLEVDYTPVSISDNVIQETVINLQNYPNPFNPETTISFHLTAKDAKDAKITIYNFKGQKIRQYSIFNSQSSIVWDGRDESNNPVSSGIYLYKLQTTGFSKTKKMILLQ